MTTVERWSIPGSHGRPIIGNAHLPDRSPRGTIVIAHGFKGYKDYGMFPAVAATCAEAGFIAHRFNFSHSGMTERIETFERPDLFQMDTWNRQVHDVRAVADAVRAGRLAGAGAPVVMFGHSRGGASVLLAAGRHAEDADSPQPVGIVTAASPSTCNPFDEHQARELLERGSIESPSARTGQTLRVGRDFLAEQLEDPAGHDLLRLVGAIRCPLLVIHGSDDPTVPPACAEAIVRHATGDARLLLIDGADHVFNTPNPMPPGASPSRQLRSMIDALIEFAGEVSAAPGA